MRAARKKFQCGQCADAGLPRLKRQDRPGAAPVAACLPVIDTDAVEALARCLERAAQTAVARSVGDLRDRAGGAGVGIDPGNRIRRRLAGHPGGNRRADRGFVGKPAVRRLGRLADGAGGQRSISAEAVEIEAARATAEEKGEHERRQRADRPVSIPRPCCALRLPRQSAISRR